MEPPCAVKSATLVAAGGRLPEDTVMAGGQETTGGSSSDSPTRLTVSTKEPWPPPMLPTNRSRLSSELATMVKVFTAQSPGWPVLIVAMGTSSHSTVRPFGIGPPLEDV